MPTPEFAEPMLLLGGASVSVLLVVTLFTGDATVGVTASYATNCLQHNNTVSA